MPEEIARSRSEKRKIAWLALEEESWSELVKTGRHEGQGSRRMRSRNQTFKEFIPVWIEGYANENLGEYTLLTYQGIVNSRLIPEFGDTWIDEITTLDIVTWFAQLKNLRTGKPLATNSKLNIYKTMKSIFDAAHSWRVIKDNPMEGIDRPSQSKKEKKEIRSRKKNYTRAEVEMLIVKLYTLPDNWRLYFTGVMLGGYRRGEYLAIEWSDVDYEQGAIWIDKQITFDKEGNKIESEVKTEESENWVSMPRWYMDDLKAYEREWRKEKLQCRNWLGGDKEYIFHSGNGEMYFPTTPTNTWGKFLKQNDLPHVKLHGLRHTAGNLLRELGTDLKTIQERLRHTKLGTTADIYTHENKEISRAAADQLEILNPRNSKIAP